MINNAEPFLVFIFPDENVYGNALLNVKNIFVFSAVESFFFFLAVAVQVKNINLIKCFKQMFSHLAVRDAVNKRIIGNHRHYAGFIFLYKMLGKAEKLDVIVIKIYFPFSKSIF